MRNLSLNRQELSEIIHDNCIYVDKTQQIHQLITTGKTYFLSRPRRFGKSLLVNTFKEIFKGNKVLFKETWIYDKIDWEPYPVLKLDFSKMPYKQKGLETSLIDALKEIGNQYKIRLKDTFSSGLLEELIVKLSKRYGQVAILIDEYDKPISDYIDMLDDAEKHREALKSFYSCLKGLDSDIKFLFITGVSKFSKVSIFSDLNHLTDLTIDPGFSTLLGYTKKELETYFSDYLQSIANNKKLSLDDLYTTISQTYNGYSWDGKNFVYNPFSIQSFFRVGEFHHFWFATGTATFLVKALKDTGKLPQNISHCEVTLSFFDKFDLKNMDLISLLFQTGYLTIKSIDSEEMSYMLAFPNAEVESAFLNNLLEVWSGQVQSDLSQITLGIMRSLKQGNPELFVQSFQNLFSGIPYDLFIQDHAIEAIFTSNVYITLSLLGVRQQVEVHTAKGRIDAVIEGLNCIFITEFKMRTAEDAMKQIHEKKYYQAYSSSEKKIFLIAIAFNEKEREISDYLIEELQQQ